MRLALAIFGIVTALVGALVVRNIAPVGIVIFFLVVAVIAAVDLVVVVRQLRQGAHFQPGPTIPPYRPVEPPPREPRVSTELSERTRMRRYLTIMITCLTLIVLAWFVVRLYSTTLAVAMSMVALVLPPIAVIVANFGVRLPEEPARRRGPERRAPEPRAAEPADDENGSPRD
jgi:uncharacterized membrane protein YfcA